MRENTLKEIISEMIESMKGLVDVESVIGKPVTTDDGTIIIPVTQVSLGFGASGIEISPKILKENGEYPFSGGGGGGLNVTPMAFLIIKNDNIRVLPIQTTQGVVDKVVDMIPVILDKANGIVQQYTKKPQTSE